MRSEMIQFQSPIRLIQSPAKPVISKKLYYHLPTVLTFSMQPLGQKRGVIVQVVVQSVRYSTLEGNWIEFLNRAYHPNFLHEQK